MKSIIEKLGISKWVMHESMGDFWVTDIDGDFVAVAEVVYPECVINLEEKNAKLIAAAPEMLELLLAIHDNEELSIEAQLEIQLIAEKITGKTWQQIKEVLGE